MISSSSTRRMDSELLPGCDCTGTRGCTELAAFTCCLVCQHMPDLPRQRFAGVGLGQQLDAGVEPTAMHDGVLGVARGEQHREVGRRSRARRASSGLRRSPGITTSVNSRSTGPRSRRPQGPGRIARLEHAIAQSVSISTAVARTLVVVFDDQDGLGAATARARCRSSTGDVLADRSAAGRASRWCPTDLAVDLHMAARLLDETVDHATGRGRCPCLRLGGEEGSNTLSRIHGAMPLPVSVTASSTYWPGEASGMRQRRSVVEEGIAGFDRQLAARRPWRRAH